jgi:hypothetical protein
MGGQWTMDKDEWRMDAIFLRNGEWGAMDTMEDVNVTKNGTVLLLPIATP